jgi:hypothetical protein
MYSFLLLRWSSQILSATLHSMAVLCLYYAAVLGDPRLPHGGSKIRRTCHCHCLLPEQISELGLNHVRFVDAAAPIGLGVV